MRLGVKSRIAIVASILWLGGFSFHYAQDRFAASVRIAQDAREVCDETNRLDREANSARAIKDCDAEWNRTYELFSKDTWSEGLQGALFYLVAAWLLIGIVYAIVRWILAGRVAVSQ